MSTASLAGERVTRARVQLPASGAWWADVRIDTPTLLSGLTTLTVAGLVLVGTIVRGGPYEGAGSATYRLVGGAASWGRELPAKSYRNDVGVKRSTVLADVAREAGEQLAPGLPEAHLGASWVRAAGPAVDTLHELVGRGWWVDAAGLTWLVSRPPGAVAASYQVVRLEPELRMAELATEEPERFVPGLVLAELGAALEAVEVRIASNLRVHAWGAR